MEPSFSHNIFFTQTPLTFYHFCCLEDKHHELQNIELPKHIRDDVNHRIITQGLLLTTKEIKAVQKAAYDYGDANGCIFAVDLLLGAKIKKYSGLLTRDEMMSMSQNKDKVDAYYFSNILVETKEIKENGLKH